MKRSIIIAIVLGLLGVLVFSSTALAFDPQPEPPGIWSKLSENPGVLEGMTFGDLFAFKADPGLVPFGSLIERGFDPQPEPPGRTG